ncbi:MAG: type II 3-dehydroquinate dehydratase [Burkholderiaceae bacterium]|jgi:3-dehydroquinate dehydratase-2
MTTGPLLWLLHGPNLNMLGQREPDVYGSQTLESINTQSVTLAESLGLRLECFQSNHEGELVDRIQQALGQNVKGLILNPAAFTHTSVALRDALAAVALPFVEVHLSNIHRREPFRSHSYFSDKAEAVVCGMGPLGYESAIRFFQKHLLTTTTPSR